MARTRRQTAVIAAQRVELLTSAFEHSAVRDFIGKDRYLQLAVSKSLARAYSSRFGSLTTKTLSNVAAEHGELTLLDWARIVGCNWDASVFLSAIKGGRTQTLQHLLDNNCPVPEGEDACTCAATHAGLEMLMWLREREFGWGEAVCTRAAARGNLPLLQWARDHGCAYNQTEALEEAAGGGHISILDWARGEGAQFDESLCIAAAQGGSLQTLQWLRTQNCPWDENTMNGAVSGGHCDVYLWAKRSGCEYDVNSIGLGGMSFLMVGIIRGHVEIVKILLADGADYNRPLQGQKPLHIAVMFRRVDIALALISAGARVNDKDVDSKTPLLMACHCGDLDMVNALLAKGANMELCDKDGSVPLTAATEGGHIVVVRALLEAGANIHHRRHDSKNALHIAFQCRDVTIGGLLLKWKAVITLEGLTEVFSHYNFTVAQALELIPNSNLNVSIEEALELLSK